MIVLFTDFGADDIYVAQVKAVLLRHAHPGTVIADLLHSVPNFDARAGAHLLAALQVWFPPGAVFFAVVDPGVGSTRDAIVMEAGGRWYVGPDNGLLSVIAARSTRAVTSRIVWRPDVASASFHGRDLFAPVAAWLSNGAQGGVLAGKLEETAGLSVRLDARDLAEVIYCDHYGNIFTGLRAGSVPRNATIKAGKHRLSWARVFAEAPAHGGFWYENSIGLIEIAVSGGNAAVQLGLRVGDAVDVIAP
jgi:S-adenosylmethionine hydrolase